MKKDIVLDGWKQVIENIQLSSEEKVRLYKEIISFIDLTTLEGTDNEEKIHKLCEKALSTVKPEVGIAGVAAVCVYPIFVSQVVRELQHNRSIGIASVAGAFPPGQSPLFLRLEEVTYAVSEGATEIDMVISRGKLLSGDKDFVYHEVLEHKKACKSAHLKVILETGELKDFDLIYEASMISMKAGGDFIKTSTGKIQPAATLDASWIMLHAIKDYYQETGRKVGFKAAGGISEPDVAIHYYMLVKHVLGEEWLTPSLFRIGASRLLDHLLIKING